MGVDTDKVVALIRQRDEVMQPKAEEETTR
jgi:hypothetical protein